MLENALPRLNRRRADWYLAMLLSIQFPIADSRSFIPNAPSRLPFPSRPIPVTEPTSEEEFVHFFGPAQRRHKGGPGVKSWSDEAYYVLAKSALIFPDLGQYVANTYDFLPNPGFITRRLFCGDGDMARVEISYVAKTGRIFKDNDCLKLVSQFLDLPTRVQKFSSSRIEKPLFQQGKNLAQLYLYGSTSSVDRSKVVSNSSYVKACDPLVLIEYSTDSPLEIESLPSKAIRVNSHKFGGIPLAYVRFRYEDRNIGTWFLGRNNVETEAIRNLRLSLFRLHAEQQTLTQVLRWISQGKIVYEPRTESGDFIDEYLNEMTRVLFKETRDGIDQGSLREVLTAFEVSVSSDERELLLQGIKKARNQIVKKIVDYTSKMNLPPQPIVIITNIGEISGGEVTIMNGQEIIKTTINYGEGNTFNGSVNAGINIKNSYQSSEKAHTEELQELLKELTIHFSKLCETMKDQKDQDAATRKLETFVKEAASSKPEPDMLKVTGNGLIEAAKTVAEMAGPIISVVTKVAGLFGIIF